MSSNDDSFASSDLDQLVRAACAHFEAGIAVGRLGLEQAKRVGDREVEQFLRRCVDALAQIQGNASSLGDASRRDKLARQPRGEQVSTASFAPGDGANDAEIIPEEARGESGNWPAD